MNSSNGGKAGRLTGARRPVRPVAKGSAQLGRRGKAADEADPVSENGVEPAGLATRRLAVRLIEAVLVSGQALDDALAHADRTRQWQDLEARDKGFARLIAATVFRRLGSLEVVLSQFMERPLPIAASRPRAILLAGAAQVLMIGTPAHAAINLAVEQCRRDAKAQRFDKLVNAVLRRVARDGPSVLAGVDGPKTDVPDWLWQRWVEAYGEAVVRSVASASLVEAPLDITATRDSAGWAAKLGGTLLATGSIRLANAGRVEELAGFSEGAWWIQDAAAALPVRLLGPLAGLDVADLCAAPGGKCAQLAAAGALVTAVDQSYERLKRLSDNMARLGFSEQVEVVASDIAAWEPGRLFDAVLLDAPCLSTGTIRRHPDLLHLKRPSDLTRTVALQNNLIERAGRLVRPGGRLLYCVCSLEPDEGEGVVARFLAGNPGFRREPVSPGEAGLDTQWLTGAGDLRTLPSYSPGLGTPGMDGFFAARMIRNAP